MISYKNNGSGWMDQETFTEWFQNIFVPLVKRTREKEYIDTKDQRSLSAQYLLIYDGHTSHYSYNLLKSAIDNNIDVIVTPAHMTHKVQPLDVAIFRHFKPALEEEYISIMANKPFREVSANGELIRAIAKVYIRTVTDKIVKRGFVQSGIFPWNPEEALKSIPGWGKQLELL